MQLTIKLLEDNKTYSTAENMSIVNEVGSQLIKFNVQDFCKLNISKFVKTLINYSNSKSGIESTIIFDLTDITVLPHTISSINMMSNKLKTNQSIANVIILDERDEDQVVEIGEPRPVMVDDEDDYDAVDTIGPSIIEMYCNSVKKLTPGDDDEDDVDVVVKHKDTSFKRSAILKAAENPKKDLYKYGVLISEDDNSYDIDKKYLKKVIKKFIPGDSKYEKEFRKLLLNRWMFDFCLTEKQFKLVKKQMNSKTRKNIMGNMLTSLDNFGKKL